MKTAEEMFAWIESHDVDIISYPRTNKKAQYRWRVSVSIEGESHATHFKANSLGIAISQAMEVVP